MALFACPFELLPAETTQPADAKRLPAMAKAYGLLGYDAGDISQAEASAIKAAGATLPAAFGVAGDAPQAATIRAGGVSIGVVRFPAAPKAGEAVPLDVSDRTAAAAAALRGTVQLVVGLSGWGTTDEAAFVRAHPGAVDVLLGSGPGLGAAGSAVGDGKTLWSRAYGRGKTVNRLDLFALPDSPAFLWSPQTGFQAEVISLDDQYPADPEIQKLF